MRFDAAQLCLWAPQCGVWSSCVGHHSPRVGNQRPLTSDVVMCTALCRLLPTPPEYPHFCSCTSSSLPLSPSICQCPCADCYHHSLIVSYLFMSIFLTPCLTSDTFMSMCPPIIITPMPLGAPVPHQRNVHVHVQVIAIAPKPGMGGCLEHELKGREGGGSGRGGVEGLGDESNMISDDAARNRLQRSCTWQFTHW